MQGVRVPRSALKKFTLRQKSGRVFCCIYVFIFYLLFYLFSQKASNKTPTVWHSQSGSRLKENRFHKENCFSVENLTFNSGGILFDSNCDRSCVHVSNVPVAADLSANDHLVCACCKLRRCEGSNTAVNSCLYLPLA